MNVVININITEKSDPAKLAANAIETARLIAQAEEFSRTSGKGPYEMEYLKKTKKTYVRLTPPVKLDLRAMGLPEDKESLCKFLLEGGTFPRRDLKDMSRRMNFLESEDKQKKK